MRGFKFGLGEVFERERGSEGEVARALREGPSARGEAKESPGGRGAYRGNLVLGVASEFSKGD